MDSLDLFFKKYAYKFPKGYPDLNDEQDINLLADLLEGLDVDLDEAKKSFSSLSSEAQSIGKEIINALNIPEDEIQSSTKNRIIILTDIPRNEVFKKLEDLGYTKNVNIKGSSAGGYVAPNGVEIIQKSKSLVSTSGAGIENEGIFVNMINTYINQSENSSVDIKIVPSTGKTLEYKNIIKCISVGKEGEKKGWKGDAILESENGTRYAISIKKDGPFRWASVMKDFEDFYNKFLSKAYKGEMSNLKLEPDPENPKVLQMINPNSNKPYGRVFITNVPQFSDEEYIKKVIFGVDNAMIVQKTFTDNDFKYNESSNVLTISVTKTITSLDEISEDELPILEFERNASKATALEGYKGRGIILRISPQERALKSTTRANNLTLTYNQAIS
jgi:hypothetical protein